MLAELVHRGTCVFRRLSACMFSTHVPVSRWMVSFKTIIRSGLGLRSSRGLDTHVCYQYFSFCEGGEGRNSISTTYTARTDNPAARRGENRNNNAKEMPKRYEDKQIPTSIKSPF